MISASSNSFQFEFANPTHTLNLIATELENPFGVDANDLDGHLRQKEKNRFLVMPLSPVARRHPRSLRRPSSATKP